MRRRLLVTVEFAHAVTNARCAALYGLPVVLLALRRRPFHYENPPARHELAFVRAAGALGFRLRLGGGRCAPAPDRQVRLSASAPLTDLLAHWRETAHRFASQMRTNEQILEPTRLS